MERAKMKEHEAWFRLEEAKWMKHAIAVESCWPPNAIRKIVKNPFEKMK